MLTAIVIALIISVFFEYFMVSPKLGGKAKGTSLKRKQNSANYRNGHFQNKIPTPMASPRFSTIIRFLKKDGKRFPEKPLATKIFDKQAFNEEEEKLTFSWFGHSSVLLKLERRTILIDPVFGPRASLFTFLGPKQYPYSQKHKLADMPEIDAVLISHDHYDHLEYESILYLKDRVSRFYVPLGVRAHLERWGVSSAKITELDWWEEAVFDEDLRLVYTPTRHFSGRSILSRNQTLWGSWSIIGQKHKVFFSGDSGYFAGFQEVGKELGPFDLAFVENGQYNEDWASIHMMPEQSALVGSELKANVVVPIHWGKFSLSIHDWDEPIERFLKAAEKQKYKVLTPAPGAVVSLPSEALPEWWKA